MSTILRISRIAAGGIVSRLADPVTGFNPRLVTAMTDAELIAPVSFKLPLDFGPSSKDFYQADVSPEDFRGSTAYRLPLVTLFALSATNKRLEKFAVFAGTVEMGLNIWFSWASSRALQDMESIGHCFEEALIGSFNDEAVADWSQRYDPRLTYDGDISLQRSKLVRDEESWSQQLHARLLVDIHAHSN